MPKAIDLVGMKFGISTVVERLGKDRGGGWIWRCRCACGTEFTRSSGRLRHRKSCGCLARTESVKARWGTAHGMSKSPEYIIWAGIKQRCRTEKRPSVRRYYADKGVDMCREWAESFETFFADMGPRPSPRHTIDRIDNDRGYEPGNCRWATREEQANNRSNNVNIEYAGETLSSAQWAKRFGLDRSTLRRRLNDGVPFEEAIKQHLQTMVTAPNGETRTVPEWGRVIGVTRTSAHRLHREGRLVSRLPTS
jgi:hypothetical protein